VQRDASRVRGTLTQLQPPHPESSLRSDSDLSPKGGGVI